MKKETKTVKSVCQLGPALDKEAEARLEKLRSMARKKGQELQSLSEEECSHEKIREYHYYNKADDREIVVSRSCEKCDQPFPILIEDEYHKAKIEFFLTTNTPTDGTKTE